MTASLGLRPILNFSKECDRIRSFENWPVSFIDPSKMAAAGFYFLKKNYDLVACAFCRVEVHTWVEGDDPMTEHRKWSPTCKYVQNIPCGNVAIEPVHGENHDVLKDLQIDIEPGKSHSTVSETPSLKNLNVCLNKEPDFPEYATYEGRIRSYRLWPNASKIEPSALSEAGFFYLGRDDRVMCFFCGVGLMDWEDGDDPWVHHSLWSPGCNFVFLTKGSEYIDKIDDRMKKATLFSSSVNINAPLAARASESAIAPSWRPDHNTSHRLKICDSNLCKICHIEERRVVFLPCGHIAACAKCSITLKFCVICWQPFRGTARVYWA